MPLQDLEDVLTASYPTKDDRDHAVYKFLGIDQPGAVCVRENDGRVLVWASEAESEDDDGMRAVWRSHDPVSPYAFHLLCSLAWIDEG